MRYSYTLGYDHYRRACKTYTKSTARRRVRYHFYMWGLFVLGVLLAASVWWLSADSLPRLVVMPLAVGAMAGGAVSILLRPWQLRKSYETHNGDLKEPRHLYLEVDGEVLVSGIEGKSEGRFSRSAVCNTAEDDAFLLLFFTKKKFIYLPKDKLAAEAMEEVRSWLRLSDGPVAC